MTDRQANVKKCVLCGTRGIISSVLPREEGKRYVKYVNVSIISISVPSPQQELMLAARYLQLPLKINLSLSLKVKIKEDPDCNLRNHNFLNVNNLMILS